jgi:signal peptidase II
LTLFRAKPSANPLVISRYNLLNNFDCGVSLKRKFSAYIPLFLISGAIVFLDQWSKELVRNNLAYTDIWSPWQWLIPYARIVHWQNTGAAFGMFQSLGIVFASLAVIISIAILYYYPLVPKEDWIIRLALALQFGGAIGNLIDRLTQNWAVTDFISVGSFAVFNVADAAVSVGVVLLIIGMWVREKRQEKTGTASHNEAATENQPPVNPLPEDVQGE